MTTWQLFHEYMLILNAIWPLVAALFLKRETQTERINAGQWLMPSVRKTESW